MEVSKFAILGNLFLAESIVVYPVIYLSLLVYRSYFYKYRLTLFDLWSSSILLVFIAFSLVPLVVFVFFVYLFLFLKMTKNMKKKFILINAFVLFVSLLILSKFISFSDYIYQTIYINLFKFVPFEAGSPTFSPLSFFTFPFRSIFFTNQGFFLIIKILSILFILTLIIIIKLKKWPLAILSYILLVGVNTRPYGFGLFAVGFHYLPYYSSLVALSIANLVYTFAIFKKRWQKLFLFGVFGVLLLSILNFGFGEFSKKTNPRDMWYVHYSLASDYAKTIKILAGHSDSLLVMPQESLIYWESGLMPSSKYFFTLNIMYSEGFVQKIKSGFEENKPDFWYIANDYKANDLLREFFGEYLPLKIGSDNSYLMVKKSQLSKTTDKQWGAVKKWGFSRPDEI